MEELQHVTHRHQNPLHDIMMPAPPSLGRTCTSRSQMTKHAVAFYRFWGVFWGGGGDKCRNVTNENISFLYDGITGLGGGRRR